MPSSAALYLPRNKVDLSSIFQSVKSDKGLLKQATFFEILFGADTARFNVMPMNEVVFHLKEFLGYVSSLDESEERKNSASSLIRQTRTVLGLVTDAEFDDNADLWGSLFQITHKYGGFIFVFDSVVQSDGTVVIGPLQLKFE